MNYTELKANINDICENNFPDDALAMFTKQAEQKIYSTVQLANLRKNVTGTLTVNNKYLSAPSDFLSTYSLAVIKANGDYLYLLNKDVNFIREAYPSQTDTGLPTYYAVFDYNTFILDNLHDFLLPEGLYRDVTDFGSGTTLNIKTVGTVTLQDAAEDTPLAFNPIDTGTITLSITDYVGDAWKVSDELQGRQIPQRWSRQLAAGFWADLRVQGQGHAGIRADRKGRFIHGRG